MSLFVILASFCAIMIRAIRRVAIAVFSAVCVSAGAQSVDYDYYPYAREEADPLPHANPVLLYGPASTHDLFSDIVRFRSHPVRFRVRGTERNDDALTIEGLSLDDAATHTAPYGAVSALYASFCRSRNEALVTDDAIGCTGNVSVYSAFAARNVSDISRITVRLSDRAYRIGIRGQTGFVSKSGKLEAELSADVKYGPDAHVGGVFTSAAGYALSVRRLFDTGADITFFTAAMASREGTRSAAVREVQRLSGDNLYNPLWGYRDGKVLNSRIRSGFMPLTVLSARIPLKKEHVINLAAGFICGRSGQSALAWFDAATPMPDYYRYLPSGMGREDAALLVEEQWRTANSRFTQIDWDELEFQNRYSEGCGHYIIEQRIERPRHFHARVGSVYSRGPLTVSYGIRIMAGVTERYKMASDMLGASYVLNIDQYQTEDMNFGAHVRNDLRQKDYRVREGDRLGYDYSIRQGIATLYGQMEYRGRRLSALIGVRLGGERVVRDGHYENQRFPKNESYGVSAPIRNVSYALGANVKAVFGPLHSVFLTLDVRRQPADFDDMFLNPAKSNLTHEDVRSSVRTRLRLGYDFNMAGRMRLQFSLSGDIARGRTEIIRYYDDLSSMFSDAAVSYGMQLCSAAEIAAQIDLTRRLTLGLAARYGYSGYTEDARTSIYSDADGSVTASGMTCGIKGRRAGNTPDAVAIAELSYRNRGWWVKLSAGCYAERFVPVNPLFFTSRVRGLAVSPETAAKFVSQERLPVAATVNIQASKTFFMKKSGYITASLSVNNLLCDREIVYSAYSQMRILKTGSGMNRSFAPAPNKYLYAYPLSCRISLSYTFR